MWFLDLLHHKMPSLETMGLKAIVRAKEAGVSAYYSDGNNIIEERPDGSLKHVVSKTERAA